MRNSAARLAENVISGAATRYCATSRMRVLPEPGSAESRISRGVTYSRSAMWVWAYQRASVGAQCSDGSAEKRRTNVVTWSRTSLPELLPSNVSTVSNVRMADVSVLIMLGVLCVVSRPVFTGRSWIRGAVGGLH
jgi:hypothetical protein